MGTAIGTRLLQTGHTVIAFDLDRGKVSQLEILGAQPASSAADAAAKANSVVLSLNSSRIVREAVFGGGGVVHGAKIGTVVVDMSSIEPVATRQLSADAAEAGLKWLDCPLSGGAPKALEGKLTVMVGGDPTDFAQAKLILDDLCQNLTLMGPSGSGQTTKLINQVLCALNFVAVAEATRLAVDAGVDAQRIPAALSGGRADSAILQEYMGKMARNDYSPTGRIDNMVKDLMAVQSLAGHTGTAMPMTSLCMEIHRLMMAAGLGAADSAALVRFYDGPRG
ncbi:2-hydroxy-3-oxopropionate reductase [Rhizobium sp. BK176]|nr:2-hydroxy-3-oxopropionate reductase [Rhizobium sp. BK181]MBB3543182.1 2-hydroxy-3-oxopropionate reductase [Rhizobium sp. BK399]MCS3744205.1 2-hydroxy-3-oxopropionate reductase [Rhizobium sp. BK661]MCS4096504.1 2-hydroxy-3-oxopropionate reductase [Rhizobium sp. BK176]